jgi:uncharacterized protein YcbK (DUF882 family)
MMARSLYRLRAVVLSALRSPETNAMLARTTFGVAENSQISMAGRSTYGSPPGFPMR